MERSPTPLNKNLNYKLFLQSPKQTDNLGQGHNPKMKLLHSYAVAVQAAIIAVLTAACAHTEGQSDTAGDPDGTDSIVSQSIIKVDGKDLLRLDINTAKASVELVDSLIPNIEDPKVCLCVEAAFTGEKTDSFSASNVAGDYVSIGRLRHGYNCEANTGLLYSTSGRVTIEPIDSLEVMIRRAEANGGSLFQQMLLVYDGKDVYGGRPIYRTKENIYRAVCLFDRRSEKADVEVSPGGGFTVIQSRYPVTLDCFVTALVHMGVRHALYLDMGMGWNYGWFRAYEGAPAHLLFAVRSVYQTNWLVVRAC